MAKSVEQDTVKLVNLSHGDPMMFEPFWKVQGDDAKVVFNGQDAMSYFSNPSGPVCWFLEEKLEAAVRGLHRVVGNAETDGKVMVVGNGATQLFQAALYALSCDSPQPPTIVTAAPFYSSYKEETEFLRSGLYKWGGDANIFCGDGPYIELVTSPNNPDGAIREAVVKRPGGVVIHDLAYYWPQYTPITATADHDMMLFTFSKATGHAGSRLGWALVKDQELAKKMVKFVMLASIGVSKPSQIRAAKLIDVIIYGCQRHGTRGYNLFSHVRAALAERWGMLLDAMKLSKTFTLESRLYDPQPCKFSTQISQTFPAFAWLRFHGDLDPEEAFKAAKLLTKGGRNFGCDRGYLRVSMLGTDEAFDLFLRELVKIGNPVANGGSTNQPAAALS